MAWDRRTLAALAICSTTQALLLSCNGSEFASSSSGNGSSGGSSSGTGGKDAGEGGSKAAAGTGSQQGGKGGSGTSGSGSGGATNGGQTNPGGAGDPDPGAGGEGTPPNPGFQAPSEGLVYWFSADFGVNQQDGAVSSWKNRASTGYHAVQVAPTLRPKLMEADPLPMPLLAFDGVDDYFELPELTGTFDGGVSVFVVTGPGETNTCSAFIELSNGPEINDIHFGAHGNAIQYEIDTAVLKGEEGIFPLGEVRLVEAHQSPAAASEQTPVEMRVNGAQAGSTAMNLPGNVSRISNFLGRTLYDTCGVYSGGIAELLFYSRKVSADERTAIELYLLEKWQLEPFAVP